MCGITGYINLDKNKSVDFSVIKRMTDTIIHRGPDAEGFYVKNNVALGHRRLSIIDLNTGNQPMYNDDKTIVVIFNGEIYNYIELREELKAFGFKFRTNSDTEVIIKSYEKWGVDCQVKFNGCWAFAIWDDRNQQLFLSRDRIGEKPLHYAVCDDAIIFGSEIRSIFEFGLPKEPLLEFIELYLVFTNIPSPYTFYKDIFKLKPGHYLVFKDGTIKEHQYWRLPEIDESAMISNKKKVYDHFEWLLRDSVKIRMRSDVPFGAFLSGGLDSSSIVAIMSGISQMPVETFTIGFNNKQFDESQLAVQVAEKYKTNHHLLYVSPDSFDDSLKKVTFHYDEPFGDSSAIPTGYISAFAHEKVKMVLTGDGGDEVLSGYNSYLGLKISSLYMRFPEIFRRNLPKGIHKISRSFKGNAKYILNRLENISTSANKDFNIRMLEKMAYTNFEIIKRLSSPIKNVIKVEDFFSQFMAKCTYKDDFYKLMYINFMHDLPNDYLVKVDRMSMAHSLEARIPFLDHRLIEFMCCVDKKVKMQGWERKSVLRKTIGKDLPRLLLKAPKKGFGIPLRDWFKDNSFSYKLRALMNQDLPLDKLLLKKIIEDNKNGVNDNGNFIWSLFVLSEKLIG
jgi:asparagine synthase (glutamine-hydrolysing)